MIVSVSRRTDIPAFYSEWFMNRVNAGFLLTRNPFNHNQVKRVSLLPQDVDAFVFWTRNPSKLIPHLPKLDQLGHRYYFQFTITGYTRELESSTLHPLKAIDVFKRLSQTIGKEKVIWRYDPIMITEVTPVEEHIRLFGKIAKELSTYTDNVVISFADFYGKTERNLQKANIQYQDILQYPEDLQRLCRKLSEIASQYGLSITTCSEGVELSHLGIGKGKCIDDNLLNSIFGISIKDGKDKNQRLECGCVKSVDIGVYNTCLHGCVYCYATYNKGQANNNFKKHDPSSLFLVGDSKGFEHFNEPIEIQTSLF
ncbi:DUF1848 domain-containing protein [Vibrio vulnificus]|uniref:DUF1848 domain-containing protein n=1 Tax=Vibrio vulnificus TaxID=672 RepID=UPI0005F0CE82|nr:DUF1848 domain-containing protein [Vibrio vulnificus]MDS1828981.1 DUF1848 domain-containing protein [Vibrio vulnificus]